MNNLDLIGGLWQIVKVALVPGFGGLFWLYNKLGEDIKEIRGDLSAYKLFVATNYATNERLERILSDIREDMKEIKNNVFDLVGRNHDD